MDSLMHSHLREANGKIPMEMDLVTTGMTQCGTNLTLIGELVNGSMSLTNLMPVHSFSDTRLQIDTVVQMQIMTHGQILVKTGLLQRERMHSHLNRHNGAIEISMAMGIIKPKVPNSSMISQTILHNSAILILMVGEITKHMEPLKSMISQ